MSVSFPRAATAHRMDRDEQRARQDAGQLGRQVRQTQAVLQDASASTPSSVPWIVPRPPKIEVPPSTTAVMAISS